MGKDKINVGKWKSDGTREISGEQILEPRNIAQQTRNTNVVRNGNTGWQLRLIWWGNQNIAQNQTTLNVELRWVSMGSSWIINSSPANKTGSISFNVTQGSINAGAISSNSLIAGLTGNQNRLLLSGTRVITHNATGQGALTITGAFDPNVNLSGTWQRNTTVGSGGITLPTIPRASTITSAINWTGGNNLGITISRASTAFVNDISLWIQNTGGGWVQIVSATGVATAHTFNFTPAQNAQIYTLLAGRNSTPSQLRLQTRQGATNIGGQVTRNGTLTALAASTMPNLQLTFGVGNGAANNIQNIPSGTISRANANLTHDIQLRHGNTVIHQITNVGTSETMTLNAAQRDVIFALMREVNELNFTMRIITRWQNGAQVRSHVDRNIIGVIVNSNPSFTTTGDFPRYRDNNPLTTNVLGISVNDINRALIQNQSTMVVDIPLANAATGMAGADIVSYTVACANVIETLDWSGTGMVSVTLGTIDSAANTNLVVTTTDSRGNTTTLTTVVIMIPYAAPTVEASAARENNFENNTVISVGGGFSLVNFESLNRNAIQSVEYRTGQGANWSEWQSFNWSSLGALYTAPDVIADLDNAQTWNVQVRVTDRLTPDGVLWSTVIGEGRPILFVSSRDGMNSVGVNKLPEAHMAIPEPSLDIAGNFVTSIEQGTGQEIARFRQVANNTIIRMGGSAAFNWIQSGTMGGGAKEFRIQGFGATNLGVLHLGALNTIMNNDAQIGGNLTVGGNINGMNLSDSGWINMLWENGWANHGGTAVNVARVRRIGNIVHVRGVATNPMPNTLSTDTQSTMCTLPVGFRPPNSIISTHQSSMVNEWLMHINTNGTITASRLRNENGRVNANTGAWFPFEATFMIDN